MNDIEIDNLVQCFKESTLDGFYPGHMCFAVCYPLSELLNANGVANVIAAGAIDGTPHYWLLVNDARVIDLTAGQFWLPSEDPKPLEYNDILVELGDEGRSIYIKERYQDWVKKLSLNLSNLCYAIKAAIFFMTFFEANEIDSNYHMETIRGYVVDVGEIYCKLDDGSAKRVHSILSAVYIEQQFTSRRKNWLLSK